MIDGEVVGGGYGLYKGGTIKHGGTVVIAQHQEEFGGKFSPKNFWLNPLIELNVWGKVLPATDITA